MGKQRRTSKRKRVAVAKTTPLADITSLVSRVQLRHLRLRKSESALVAIPPSPPELKQKITVEVSAGVAERVNLFETPASGN